MLRHFPFGDAFDPGMGMRLLKADECVCDVDAEQYTHEIALKSQLLNDDHAYYFKGDAESQAPQWDVVELVCDSLAQIYPDWFSLRRDGDTWHWSNALLGTHTRFTFGDAASLTQPPLDWIGRQVQEDLVLLDSDASATFVGGQLCFANGWAISDRAGKSFGEIHERTPQATITSVHAGARLLDTLKPGRTYWRTSWNFKLTDQMDMSTKHTLAYKADFARRAPMLTIDNVGREVFVRIERQTFTRLSCSRGVLFGIHTYNSSLKDEARDPDRARRILAVIRGTPDDVKIYKAIAPIEAAMTVYLEQRASS